MWHRHRAQERVARGRFLIEQVSGWIAHADGKTAILAAFVGVAVAGIASQLPAISAAIVSPTYGCVMLLTLLVWLISLLGVALNIDKALRPRVTASGAPNPYSWPDLAKLGAKSIDVDHRDEPVFVELQAQFLAETAKVKFDAFARALSFAWLFLASSLIALAILLADSTLTLLS